jgi:type II secretory pathway predicted ATPase ExeA
LLPFSGCYRALSYELGLEPAHKKITMFNQIQERIRTLHESKNIVPIIILDEVQYLKNSILDDLKIIFNFDLDSKNYAILILSGQPILNSILQRQAHEALKQRIVINYTFGGLTKDEVFEYINTRLKLCGIASPIFTEDALELIATTCGGCTRKINLLVEKSLILGYQKKSLSIDGEIIYSAQNDIELTI